MDRKAAATTHLVEAIRRILTAYGGVRMAILFGSLAKGHATPESDLDLAVSMAGSLTTETKMALIGDLAGALGRPVDLLDLRMVGEPLLGQILQHGVRLLGSDADHAELIKRHLFADADFMPYQRRILAERRRAWIGK
jgi:uncharacterized protein